jgi:hypothetical protein
MPMVSNQEIKDHVDELQLLDPLSLNQLDIVNKVELRAQEVWKNLNIDYIGLDLSLRVFVYTCITSHLRNKK